MLLKTFYAANSPNTQVLLYDGHDRFFDDKYIHILCSHHIKSFVLKAGESGNDKPNDNGPNLEMKGLYGRSRMNWQRQHGTLKFKNPHMNAVLVETWRYFQLSSAPGIINTFKKIKLLPLTPPHEDTNSQSYLTESQTTKGGKSGEN